ncbi:CBS domain-containing protein [Streptomyces sp. GXMU-J15]|uniref:CBS domain-containing protein n=1 Tax=Streptomyces fuscus TaxID=3048495 RepID=A0ABT7IUJ5_9ACTN|nr:MULTISPECIES: CBS domain-containing protein [Streptomyces]MDL2076255.1 CBS domain-containing protein [Streptomyces fuscus]SBT94068.1 BON domain-containing protein [Streptomyces sp. DI166]
MNHLRVRDVMSDAVVRVQGGTPFKEIAHLLQEYDITAVPVVDDQDRPLGVVSEADLLHKMRSVQDDTDTPEATAPPDKARATDAAGLMTSPPLCAREDWSVVEAARMMAEHGVKRLLVTGDDGRLIGVVSRSDLLRVFLRTDQAIRREIVEEILVKELGEAPSAVQVDVTHGHVVLTGHLSSPAAVPVLEALCRNVDGVVEVEFRSVTAADPHEPLEPSAPTARA